MIILVLNNQRKELIKCREEMDFAKHEYANHPTEQKKEACSKAIAKFNEQLEEVIIQHRFLNKYNLNQILIKRMYK